MKNQTTHKNDSKSFFLTSQTENQIVKHQIEEIFQGLGLFRLHVEFSKKVFVVRKSKTPFADDTFVVSGDFQIFDLPLYTYLIFSFYVKNKGRVDSNFAVQTILKIFKTQRTRFRSKTKNLDLDEIKSDEEFIICLHLLKNLRYTKVK
jgi:hypothetical protein